jgi:hypothetical protein
MSNSITWDELKARWNSADYEIIDRIKQGLLLYSKITGNLYDCPREHHFGYHAEILISELTDQIKKLTKELGKSSTEVSKLQYERSIHEKQLEEIINEDPDYRSWEYFTFGRNEIKAKRLISKFKNDLIFKLKNVEDFEKKQGRNRIERTALGQLQTYGQQSPAYMQQAGGALSRALTKEIEHKTPQKNEQLDGFIKGLIVFCESDSDIKIQEAGKRAKSFGLDSLEFRDNQTKEWKYFQEILKHPNHIFALGPAGGENSTERKTYNARRSVLIAINKKLIEFFKKEFGLQIPEEYKFYEIYPKKGPGIYKFKFGIPKESYSPERLEAQYEALKDFELKEKIKDLAKRYKKAYDEKCEANLVAATKVAQRRGILSDDQVKAMLEPTKDPEKHIYDPYENVESI